MEEPYDIRAIMRFLPHRYPFLMIDRILDLQRGKSITALKNVSINEPFFKGHFPESPIMPGVLVMESMGQAGGVLVISSLPPERHGSLVYFMGLDHVRFRKPVIPGDQLILRLDILKERKTAVKMSGTAHVEEKLVAEAEFMATIGEKA